MLSSFIVPGNKRFILFAMLIVDSWLFYLMSNAEEKTFGLTAASGQP